MVDIEKQRAQQRDYYRRTNEKRREQQRAYHRRKPKKPCPVCGIPIRLNSYACRKHCIHPRGEQCHRWKGGKEQAMLRFIKKHDKHCVDCGREISYNAEKYCFVCARKHRPLRSGGRRVLKGGYIQILRAKHPRANRDGYVLEHIVNWEEAKGKSLPQSWIIHHLNGVKGDNRIINLVALPNKKHCHVLQAKAKRILELESLLKGQLMLV